MPVLEVGLTLFSSRRCFAPSLTKREKPCFSPPRISTVYGWKLPPFSNKEVGFADCLCSRKTKPPLQLTWSSFGGPVSWRGQRPAFQTGPKHWEHWKTNLFNRKHQHLFEIDNSGAPLQTSGEPLQLSCRPLLISGRLLQLTRVYDVAAQPPPTYAHVNRSNMLLISNRQQLNCSGTLLVCSGALLTTSMRCCQQLTVATNSEPLSRAMSSCTQHAGAAGIIVVQQLICCWERLTVTNNNAEHCWLATMSCCATTNWAFGPGCCCKQQDWLRQTVVNNKGLRPLIVYNCFGLDGQKGLRPCIRGGASPLEITIINTLKL